MFCGLYFKKALLRLIGNALKNSEWSQVIVHADIFTSGVADNLLAASHIKKTRRAHDITSLTLWSRQASDEQGIHHLTLLKSHGSKQFKTSVCARFLGNEEFGKAINRLNKSTLDLFGKSRKTKKNTQPLLKHNASLF